jgi:hypothetical protein
MPIDTGFIDINLHSLSENDKIIFNPIELFFQEVEIAIKTFPGEIWGCTHYVDINRYVFNKYISLTQIKNELSYYITKNCSSASKNNWNISVSFYDASKAGKEKNEISGDLVYILLEVNHAESKTKWVNKYLLGQAY